MGPPSVARAVERLRSRDEHALPWDDDSVERLSAEARTRVGHYWQGRATSELQVATAFERFGAMLRETGSEPAVVALVDASVENERYHAALCERLAARYLGTSITPAEAGVVELPELPELDPATRTAVYAAGLCAVNESIATVWLKHCLDRATTPLARAVSQIHLADEVMHARMGFAHLASRHVSPAARAELARRLPALLRINVAQWLRSSALCGLPVPDHGLPDANDQRACVLGAVRDVVLPGFAHVGIDVAAAQRWLDAEFR